jgi:predicted acylesterase/phospholipase RssA
VATEARRRDYSRPTDECDLVMKGGITSGVVYPPAILALAEKYRFRSIGGASAGAIAAAAAAAAELGREREGAGFDELDRVSRALAEPVRPGVTRLRALFQPIPEARPLMDVLFALADHMARGTSLPGRVAALAARSVVAAWQAALSGAVLGLLALAALGWLLGARPGWGTAAVALAFASLGALSGAVARLVAVALGPVRENGFGLCTGLTVPGDPSGQPGLTDWLHATLNRLAGRPADGPPLTFRDLKERADGKPSIELVLMTTNLSLRGPWRFPQEKRIFLFKEEEMAAYFPPAVVRRMVEHSYRSETFEPPPGYRFLPECLDLPVVVAVRMSLSFPFLFSAVPLYTIASDALQRRPKTGTLVARDLRVNWFSDGGIVSNFPIHFFDRWLPSRPTLGLNLASHPPEAIRPTGPAAGAGVDPHHLVAIPADDSEPTADAVAEGLEDVFLPEPNPRGMRLDWRPVGGLFGLLAAAFDTARSYRDSAQMLLPSYRERVVQIRLSGSEGGLNLAMSDETIRRIEAKGRRAGEVLANDFDFDEHRWVRFLVLMAQLEDQFQSLGRVYRGQDPDPGFARLLEELRRNAREISYSRNGAWLARAIARAEALVALVDSWESDPGGYAHFNDHRVPRPPATLRVAPPD